MGSGAKKEIAICLSATSGGQKKDALDNPLMPLGVPFKRRWWVTGTGP